MYLTLKFRDYIIFMLADIFYYINKMPYSFVTEEIISNEVHNKFIFMVNPNASEFYITLMHGEPDENEYSN